MDTANQTLPRLGFLGVGWIGRNRLASLAQSGAARIAAIADPSDDNYAQALQVTPDAMRAADLQQLLDLQLDGIVIATPSAQHADQAATILKAGVPVFCQKPLALSAAATRRVIATAREANRLLGIDLSYRYLRGLADIRRSLAQGAIGKVYAVELVFHNAYGPDKPWYFDPAAAGGGCVIDLGTHLVDIMLYLLGFPQLTRVDAHLYAAGRPLDGRPVVEDYAAVQLELENDISVRLACSWNLQAGCEAIIQAAFYGTQGGFCIRNLDGSFYMFQAERFRGTTREIVSPPSDDWWGAAAVQWARDLGSDRTYNARIEQIIAVAETLDAVYDAARQPRPSEVNARHRLRL